jgi:predicted dinucleotide-utilizing enzyme
MEVSNPRTSMEVHPVIIHVCWGDFRIFYENDEKQNLKKSVE